MVEWPEKGEGFIPQPDLVLNLNYEGESRSITLGTPATDLSEKLLKKIDRKI